MPNDQETQDQNTDFEPRPAPNKPLNRNQKIAVAGLAVFGILVVMLWLVQLKNNIYGPFNVSSGLNQNSLSDQALANEQALKNKDTDSDGLSDWDELNLYNTSPYLADSDSDTLSDGDEVTKGTDPNCPLGRTCNNGLLDTTNNGQTEDTLNSPESGQSNLQNQTGSLNDLLDQNNGTTSLTPEDAQALKDIDAASLRLLLLQNGMDKAILDKISDEELMRSYGEVLQ
jgi:hypothetical protein